MKCIRILEPNRVEIAEIPVPAPREDEVLIRVSASGICGTDIHILRGEYMGGYPVIPGHEFSGTVVQAGAAVTRFRVGERVAVEPNIPCDNCPECLHNRQNFCRNWQAVGVTLPGGMAEYVAVPEAAGLPDRRPAFRTGRLRRAALLRAARAGTAGPAHGRAHRHPGGRPDRDAAAARRPPAGRHLDHVAERNPARLALCPAIRRGRRRSPAWTSCARTATTRSSTRPASPAVMRRCLDFARPGGKVLWFGVPPAGQEMSIEPFKVFRKGLAIFGSFTSLRNSYQAVDLLRSGRAAGGRPHLAPPAAGGVPARLRADRTRRGKCAQGDDSS